MILQLPDALLGRCLASVSSTDRPVKLMLVCKRFHRVLLTQRHLWTTISLPSLADMTETQTMARFLTRIHPNSIETLSGGLCELGGDPLTHLLARHQVSLCQLKCTVRLSSSTRPINTSVWSSLSSLHTLALGLDGKTGGLPQLPALRTVLVDLLADCTVSDLPKILGDQTTLRVLKISNLSGVGPKGSIHPWLKKLTRLETLVLRLKCGDVNALFQHDDLTLLPVTTLKLILSHTPSGFQFMRPFALVRDASVSILSHASPGVPAASQLAHWVNVERLRLFQVPVGPLAESLRLLTRLTHLILTECGVQHMHGLSDLTQLLSLTVRDSTVKTLAGLTPLTRLRILSLDTPNVYDLSLLAAVQGLEEFSIGRARGVYVPFDSAVFTASLRRIVVPLSMCRASSPSFYFPALTHLSLTGGTVEKVGQFLETIDGRAPNLSRVCWDVFFNASMFAAYPTALRLLSY